MKKGEPVHEIRAKDQRNRKEFIEQVDHPQKREGDAPLVGFSPRKAKISLYFAAGDPDRETLLQSFGKHTTGKGCVYINKVADIDVEVLKKLIHQSIKFPRETYPNP